MESVNVVCAVLLDDRDDALAHSREYRGNHDRGQYADDNAQHGEEAAEFVATNTVERHAERLAHFAFRNFGPYRMNDLHYT